MERGRQGGVGEEGLAQVYMRRMTCMSECYAARVRAWVRLFGWAYGSEPTCMSEWCECVQDVSEECDGDERNGARRKSWVTPGGTQQGT